MAPTMGRARTPEQFVPAGKFVTTTARGRGWTGVGTGVIAWSTVASSPGNPATWWPTVVASGVSRHRVVALSW